MVKKYIALAIVALAVITNATIASLGNANIELTWDKNLVKIKEQHFDLKGLDAANDTLELIAATEAYAYFTSEQAFIRYSLKKGEISTVDTLHKNTIGKDYVVNDNIVRAELVSDDEKQYVAISEINFDKGEIVPIANIGENNFDCVSMPYITVLDNYLLVNSTVKMFEENVFTIYQSHVMFYDIKTWQSYRGLQTSYAVDENGQTFGQKIVYSGGYQDTALVQILTANFETVEKSKNNRVVAFELSNTAENSMRTLKDIETYSTGENVYLHIDMTEDYFLGSLYDYDKPLVKSGVIAKKELERLNPVHVVPQIESGRDIRSSRTYEGNRIAFINDDSLFFYDMENAAYYVHPVDKTLKESCTVSYDKEGAMLSYFEQGELAVIKFVWR